MQRRHFLAAAGLAAAPGSLAAARRDFPWADREVYLNCATEHPLPLPAARAMEDYVRAITYGPDKDRARFEGAEIQNRVRDRFAALIGAKPLEVGFVPATQIAENLIVDGLEIAKDGANIVTNDLHYGGSLLNYNRRIEQGLDVRIVKSRDGRIDLRDVERAVDRKTRLIAVALVSNVNGFVEDAPALSKLAHAHGGYLYTDVIQAAGAVPIDVHAMGIDFLACSAYKWLMGGRFGYLYVREDLQGGAMKVKHFGGRSGQPGAGRYQVSTASHVGCACQDEALAYIARLGVENIQKHNQGLHARLRREMPALGFRCLTPEDSPAPISTFQVPDVQKVTDRLRKARVIVTLRGDGQMRVSPSVFNHQGDLDVFLNALS
ncbi:MAG: aminotransferase class V-fold PLP-dependent enzyme [Bryobacterales bacterium]|nr:aminotransferase class V-fold PLP-dependent enzyme [Bryobacterales bacterium]